MSIDNGPALPGQVRQGALTGLSDALTALATRLRTRAAAARDFVGLTDRAKKIAARAWDVRTSKWGFVENSEKLAADLVAFAQDVAVASARASAEIEGNAAIVDALDGQAERIAMLGRSATTGAVPDVIRAALEPLEATVQGLRARVFMGNSVSSDAANFAQKARDLAACARSLRGGGREAEEAAATIIRALNEFADVANSIAARMSSASAGLSNVVACMSSRAVGVTLHLSEASSERPAPWHQLVLK